MRKGQANSHAGKGWEILSDRIIQIIDQKEEPVVFLLWGKHALAKMELLKNPNHLVLTSSHPSPYSADYGFKGCRHFSKANAYLQKQGIAPIDWCLSCDE